MLQINQLFLGLSNSEVVGLTLIGEARGEPIEGIVAVGSVIRNRLHSNPEKYKSYHEVVFEKLQFSCWNLNDPNYAFLKDLAMKMVNGQKIIDPYLRQCFTIGIGIVDWGIIDNTKGCKFYMEKNLFNNKRPDWAKNAKGIIEKGNHIFFQL